MKSIAITGGIATGKSSATTALIDALGAHNCIKFDCDETAHKLLTSEAIVATIRQKFGNEVIHPDGSVNRSALRDIVFGNDANRLELEDILHPKILKSAETALNAARNLQQNQPSWFVMEIPLLYEVKFPIERDLEIVVATSRETQIKRLSEHRNLESDIIEKLLAAQLPIEDKVELADIVIWNEGTPHEFTQQIKLLQRALDSQSVFTK